MNLCTLWVRWHLREAFCFNPMGKMAVLMHKELTQLFIDLQLQHFVIKLGYFDTREKLPKD